MTYGIFPVIIHWLNWQVTYQISLRLWLVAFEFVYKSVEIDFDWLGCWCVSRPAGLRNEVGIVCATISLDWVEYSCLFYICNILISSPYDFALLGVTTCLCPICLWHPHKIVSVSVSHSSIDISRQFADKLGAHETVSSLAHRLLIVTGRKSQIHGIRSAKRIWNYRAIIV
jgi:hypothetical protein